MMKRVASLLMTLVAATVGIAGPATALTVADLPTADLNRTLYLTARPTASMATATMHKNLYLTDDYYGWDVGVKGISGYVDYASRSIALSAGNYSWWCAVKPHSGYYTEDCTLTNVSRGSAVAHLYGYGFVPPYDGYYTQESTLTPSIVVAPATQGGK